MVDQALAYVMMRETENARERLREAINQEPELKNEIMATPEFTGLI